MAELELQATCFDNIKTLCINYRKDAESRKTADYLQKRLLSLENQWQDFENRHAQLLLEIEDKNIPYFKDDVYEKTKEMFLSTKTDISNKLAASGKQNVKFDLGGTSEDDDSNYIQLLLNKQECNFNAIYRVISKIDVATITERWELEDHFTTLKSKWEPIDKLHWEIDFQLKGSNEQYYQMFTDIEHKYDELKKEINAKIWSTVHFQKSTPKIEIPEFSGNYSQWISFKDLFLEAIHKNPMINNAQKMQHLKTKLRGEAERLVQHLTISTENYNSCWDILNQRYDNRRLQFTSFANNMLSLPIIQNADSSNLKKMHDVITECLNGISNIGIDTTNWDPIIVHIMSQKLDPKTLSDYMKELQDHRELQNLHDFLYFLETQFMAYETMKSAKEPNPTASEKSSRWKTFNKRTQMKKHNYSGNQNKTSNYHTLHGKCPFCNGSHILRQCDKFLKMDFGKRNDTVSKLQLCKNCLFSHGNDKCKSTKTCKECNSTHHTLLHNSDNQNTTSGTRKNEVEQRSSSSTQPPTSNHLFENNVEVLLTTVQLRVKSVDGTYITLRALLDQGSQVNLITENAAQILRLPRKGINASVSGIGSVSRECKGKLKLTCQSIHSDYSFETQALIMTKLTNKLPARTFEKGAWTHIENLKLADPDFNVSRQIDLLLGADVYSEIILEGVLKSINSSLVAQQTQIGWILCGKMKQTFDCHTTLLNLEDLTKFWENEEIHNTKDIPKDDQCEQFYKETVRRSCDGKYIVKMPMVPNYEQKLGKSRTIAVAQFLHLEKRLEKNERLSAMYKQFMEEYADLGHMNPAAQLHTDVYFLPHHGVLRENSTTTKLRVVFNASQQTTSGYSLNNVMEKGANLQKDIQALILKWRTYKYAFTADIEKMYRCIWISEEQQNLQRIVWRDSRDHHLRDYQLCTVTYGTKCAPWLAMRTLKQLAIDDGHKHPEAAKILMEECYVDDVISGHNNLTEAKNLQQSLIQLLKGGGMNLRKWTANDRAIVEDLCEDQISKQTMFDFKGEEASKTLGLSWDPNSDTFHFNWPVEEQKQLTKRSLLSAISRFYDPLGWLSPVTVKAKLLFQKLWMSKLNWDDVVPSNIESEWLNLKTELPYVSKIMINRWIGDTQQCVELLGFCDASEKAYACVIYSKVFNEHGQPIITLLAARTRVAPLTQKTTLPRLELCGAQLLANLMEKTKKSFSGYNISIRAWSDSQVVLAWIQGETSRWETYVANRVTKIKNVIPATQWRYIKSEQNPADCASRGLLPSKLLNFNLWWHGPELLTKQDSANNIACVFQTNLGCINHVQIKKPLQQNNEHHIITELMEKCSSLTHVNRVIAWTLRFITNMRNKTKSETTYLTTSELSAARKSIIIHAQRLQFDSEYKQLVNNETVPKKSVICKLNPYINETGIICVGGRLKHSNLPGEMKNPIIIPHRGRFTQLLIEQAHSAMLHGGARLTLTYIRQRYWIVGGNRAVKNQVRRCVRCHRFNKTDGYQLMGDLPQQRIIPCRPFTHTGVDFTGHVDVKHNKGRGVKTSKGYIAIFICMVTKAIHIELVSDLSTETFIAAFQRLCARRGTPRHIYSDCGTNFVGAAKVLRKEFEEFKQLLKPDLFNELAKLEVEWHFNAPAWPTAGGLWEAAVKSMKHHLRRVLGDQKLTYEEFTTILAKIEACLNSRPLCPLTEDPEEFYNCLTPGHFLTGSPILSMPLSDYNDVNNIDLRRRWQLIEHMFQQYWKNWSNDYLTTLQTRSKWNKPSRNVKEGDVVLVKENNLPPGKWALGRILETHPGTDGYVRVTTVKTQAGVIKRPITKLSPLPLYSGTEDAKENELENKPQQNSKRERRKRSNNPISTLLITMLSLFTFVTGSHSAMNGTREAPASYAQITSLERERPIYYDTVGKMQVVHDEWILMMYYNLTNYWEGTRRTQAYFENIKNICHKTNLQHCRSTMEQLNHEMELLNYYNFILINPHKHLSNRKKRGLIDGVGYIANSLFGILDQQFAKKYQNDIQSLQTNENYLLELIKNQTTIVELENQVLKQSEDNIQRQFNSIDNFINQTNMNIASIETEMEILSATTFINSASLTTYLLINSLRTFQEMLFNTLTNVYQGHVDVHLITPVRLMQKLTEISGSLPKSLSLPVDNYKENIKDIYKLINVKARVTETYFLFEAHIPLVANEDFDIYKAIPLPVNIDKETTYLQLSNNYIAVNFKKNVYESMSENDLKHCMQLKTQNFLCKKNRPSYDLHSKNAPCEAKLLSHQNSGPCDVKRASCKDTWIELQTQNSWLAICCETCSLRIICNNDVTSQTISSTSIVTLSQGCVLQSTDFTIYAQRQYSSRMKMDYEFTAPTVDTSINKIVNLTYRHSPTIFQSKATNQEIATIEQKFVAQRKNEASLPTITSHDIHQYVICYSLLSAAIIVALVVVGGNRCQNYCTKKANYQTTTSQPPEDIELQVIRKPEYKQEAVATQTTKDLRSKPQLGNRNIAFQFD